MTTYVMRGEGRGEGYDVETPPVLSEADARRFAQQWADELGTPVVLFRDEGGQLRHVDNVQPQPSGRTKMADFEVFHRAQPTKTTTPVVTITPRGQMILNEPAFTALGQPKAVELLYAEQVSVAAIRALEDPNGPTAFPLRVLRSGDGSHALYAAPFLDRWNLEVVDASRSWPAVMDYGLLRVDLSKPGTLTDQVMSRPVVRVVAQVAQ